MMAPLADYGIIGGGGNLAAALIIGIAFGWCLERAGMGSARKLMGQFLLTDFALFKVMFSAIVTVMLGVFWLSRLGILDLSRVYVPETWLMPQLVGGLVFGIGFGVAGLCPGTSCVAAITGRIDGAAVVAGFFIGILGAGLALPSFAPLYNATARGTLTLPDVTGLSYGAVVFVIVLIAIAGFTLVPRLERPVVESSGANASWSPGSVRPEGMA